MTSVDKFILKTKQQLDNFNIQKTKHGIIL